IGTSSQEIFLWEPETGYYSVTSVSSPGIEVCNSLERTWSMGEPGHIWHLSSCEENHARQATSTLWQQWCSNGLLVVALLMALLRRSEERRVGKECRYRWAAAYGKEQSGRIAGAA